MRDPDQLALTAQARSAIVRDSLAVGLATGTYGVSFGALSVAAGLSVGQTCALSLLMFTGASQFALIGVLAAGGAPLSGALTALLLGTRNTLYGLRLAPLLAWSGWRRAGAAHLLIDESTAMSVTRSSTAAARVGFLTTGLSIFVLWNLATFGGAVAGSAIGDPRTYGLDAAVGGAFLALLWPRLHDVRARIVAVSAAALALGLVPLSPAGVPVLAAGGIALLAGVLWRSGAAESRR
ncbi:AzlC family ABC transporter permease [Nocardioides sp.]|uniref:AzlC family ABC transporter permease n=1 Tax=Nocardioides sp. TaxID=35761 RepID=UPI0031FE9992|nr:AzlC family protein [Nocardioides sp.]